MLPRVRTGFQEDGACSAYPQLMGKSSFGGCTGCPSAHKFLPLGVSPMLAQKCFTFSHSHEVWRVLTTTDVGNVTQGQGVPDFRVLHFSGAQLGLCQKAGGKGMIVCGLYHVEPPVTSAMCSVSTNSRSLVGG